MITLNIIPPELKQQIHLDNIHKKIVSYFFISLFALAFYGIALFLISFVLQKDYQDTANSANLTTRDAENYNLETKNINSQIDQIEEIQKDVVNWSYPIMYLINNTNNGISFSNVSFSKTNNTLLISGFSNTRENLLSFKKILSDSKFLSDVNLPIENLLEKNNINFNITAKISSYEFNESK